jgi:malate synthase
VTEVMSGLDVLSKEALAFVERLQRELGGERKALLAARAERQRALDAGDLPTLKARVGDWRVRPAPPDLVDRRVEITGPVDR